MEAMEFQLGLVRPSGLKVTASEHDVGDDNEWRGINQSLHDAITYNRGNGLGVLVMVDPGAGATLLALVHTRLQIAAEA